MLNFFRKNGLHILIWGIMLLYLMVAHDVHVKFFLSESEGKPVEYKGNLPRDEDQIASAIDNMSFIDEDLFALNGWASFRSDPENLDFERLIILRSDTKTYFFSVETAPIVGILLPFSAIMSREFIQPGTYRIGFLFKHKRNNGTYYSNTNKIIVRTPNSVKLEDYKQ